jgi:hypothetical protein
MQSKLGINKSRKKNLMEIIKELFPEYKYFRIKNDGTIKFKKRWFSFWKEINFHELLFGDIINRLNDYKGTTNSVYNEYISRIKDNVYTIHSLRNRNIIDYLWEEFLRIKRPSKVERMLGCSQEVDNSTTITIRTIIVNALHGVPKLKSSFDDTIKLLRRQIDQDNGRFDRVRHISII